MGGVLISCMAVVPRPSHSHDAGTEHVQFLSTRRTLLASSAKRREVFGESHELHLTTDCSRGEGRSGGGIPVAAAPAV